MNLPTAYRSCCNNQHFMHIMTRTTLYMTPHTAFVAFFVKFALLLFFQNEICAYGNNNNCSYNIAMTSLTTAATTTTKLSDWHWSHFGVFGFGHFFWRFFWLLGCSIYNFTEIFVAWSSTRLATAAAENRAKFISFSELSLGLPDELKVEQQYLGASGCVCVWCVSVCECPTYS